ncbi:hypothetical protein [Bermanella sp. R86510]|uniref:hypothetical protein n=1 Tax=unclassified Bermanella TaxID=2627862 RepID=UPI0037C5B26E
MRFITPVLIALLLAACSGPQLKDIKEIEQAATTQAQADNGSTSDVIARAKTLQLSAQQQDLFFFSPNYMENGDAALKQAIELDAENNQDVQAKAEALKAEAFYKRGLDIKPTVKQELAASLQGFDMLRELDSHRTLSNDFNDLLDEFRIAVGFIEQGNIGPAQSKQESILEDIADLEIKTLKRRHLAPVQLALDKAKQSDADEFAEKTYNQAQQAVEALEEKIETAPKQRNDIANKSSQAQRQAQRAMYIAQTAKPLVKLNATSAEQHALWVESLLIRIAKSLNENPQTHLPLNSQSIALAQAAEMRLKQAQSKLDQQNTAARYQQQIQQLEETISKLEAQLKQTQ